MGISQSDEHVGEFGRERFIFQCFLILCDGPFDIFKVKQAVCFDDMGFAEFFIGCDSEVAGFYGLIKIFGGELTFGQPHPVSRVVWVLVDQLVVEEGGFFYMCRSGCSITIGGGCQKIFVVLIQFYPPRKPLYAFSG